MDEFSNTEIDSILSGIVADIHRLAMSQNNKRFASFYTAHANLVNGEVVITLSRKLDYLPDVEISTVINDETDEIRIYAYVDSVRYGEATDLWDSNTDKPYNVVYNLSDALELLSELDGSVFYTADYI